MTTAPAARSIAQGRATFGWMLTIEACSTAALAMARVALPWLVLERTGSASLTGVVMLALFVPMFFGSWWGGVLVDQYGPARVSVKSESASAIVLALLAGGVVGGWLGVPLLCAVLVLLAFSEPPGAIAREALVPATARLAGIGLLRANALREWVTQCVLIAAPVAAGAVIASHGTGAAFVAIALSGAAAAVLNAGLLGRRGGRLRIRTRVSQSKATAHPVLAPVLMRMLWVTVPLVAIDEPLESVILPVILFKAGDSALSLGGLDGAFNFGALCGAALFAWQGARIEGRALLVGCALAVSATLLVFAMSAPYPVLLVAAVACGAGGGMVVPMLTTLVQRRTARANLGRALGTIGMFELGGAIAGLFAAASLIDTIGARPILWGMAALALVAAWKARSLPALP